MLCTGTWQSYSVATTCVQPVFPPPPSWRPRPTYWTPAVPPVLWVYTQEVSVYTRVLLLNPVFRVSWDFFRGLPTERDILQIVTDSDRKRELNISYVLAGVIFQVCITTQYT